MTQGQCQFLLKRERERGHRRLWYGLLAEPSLRYGIYPGTVEYLHGLSISPQLNSAMSATFFVTVAFCRLLYYLSFARLRDVVEVIDGWRPDYTSRSRRDRSNAADSRSTYSSAEIGRTR